MSSHAPRRFFLRKLIQSLPKPLRFAAIRRLLTVTDESHADGIEFKVADTIEELEAAYQILHDSYVHCGFQKPDPSGLRVIKYFALPTTTTLIAKWKDTVIGTMTVIRRSPFGLPIDSIFDVKGLEADGKTVAEISSLAIARDFRHKRGALFLPLCKFLYWYLKNFMRIDNVVIAVNPEWSDFYEGILDFSRLENRVIGSYDFANGAPAVGLWSDVTSWEARFEKIYNWRPDKNNFYKYFVERETPNLHFPEREYIRAMDPVMTPEMLNYLFNIRTRVFAQLTEKEILSLHSVYPQKSYSLVLPKLHHFANRLSRRYTVHAPGKLDDGKAIRAIDISEWGLRLNGPLPRRTKFKFSIAVNQKQHAHLEGLIHWMDHDSLSYGVQILTSDQVWRDYLDNLEHILDSKKNLAK